MFDDICILDCMMCIDWWGIEWKMEVDNFCLYVLYRMYKRLYIGVYNDFINGFIKFIIW